MWHDKNNEDEDYTDYLLQKEKDEFLAKSQRIIEGDEEYINKVLISNGYDPDKLAQEGREFLNSLLHQNEKTEMIILQIGDKIHAESKEGWTHGKINRILPCNKLEIKSNKSTVKIIDTNTVVSVHRNGE